MRPCFLIPFLTVFAANAQSVKQTKSDLSQIRTVEAAEKYLSAHPAVSGKVFDLNSTRDSTDLDKRLLTSSEGSLTEYDSDDKAQHTFFKILRISQKRKFRVQYIYLDNSILQMKRIDSLRTLILQRIRDGEPFDKLAHEYSMDESSKAGGDSGWFEEGMMMKEFENRIKSNKTGEVYKVDIPSRKWYYVVRNSFEPKALINAVVLKIEVQRDK